jgi:rubrerythrin
MAGVGGASIVLAGCADDTKNPNVKTAPDESDTADVELLNAMLDMEFTTIAAYKAGAAELSGRVLQIAQDVLEQEQEHADTLSRAIRDLDGVPNRAKDSYDFRALRNERDVLRFAVELENNAIAAYVDVLPKLSQGELRSTVSGILTCEAEHACVALGALGEPQLPGAFVVGQAS